MIRNSLSLLVIISLTVAFLILWESPPDALLRKNRNALESPTFPQAIVKNSTTIRFNQNGQIDYRFTATESRHFQINPNQTSDQDFTTTTNPQVLLINDSDTHWNISADNGKTTENGKLIELQHHVKAVQLQGSNTPSTEFTTETLRIQPAIQFAETDKAVMIRSLGNSTTAVGLKASLKENTLELLSNVRGIHEPRH